MFTNIKLRRGLAALIGAASLIGSVGVLIAAPAHAANCETCDKNFSGGGGSGSSGGGTPHDIISFTARTDLGSGHVTTNSGYLDRTANRLVGTVETEANWWLYGWSDASVVTIFDKYGAMIWASPVFGPYGLDGGSNPRYDNYTSDGSGVPVPLTVVQHAASIEVFNYWAPQWTGLTKLLSAVGQGVSAVVSYCAANINVCMNVASTMFGPLL